MARLFTEVQQNPRVEGCLCDVGGHFLHLFTHNSIIVLIELQISNCAASPFLLIACCTCPASVASACSLLQVLLLFVLTLFHSHLSFFPFGPISSSLSSTTIPLVPQTSFSNCRTIFRNSSTSSCPASRHVLFIPCVAGLWLFIVGFRTTPNFQATTYPRLCCFNMAGSMFSAPLVTAFLSFCLLQFLLPLCAVIFLRVYASYCISVPLLHLLSPAFHPLLPSPHCLHSCVHCAFLGLHLASLPRSGLTNSFAA